MKLRINNIREDKTSIRKLLCEKSKQPVRDLFSQGMHEGLKKASEAIEKLISKVPNVTLQGLFEYIIREAGVLSYIMQSDEKIMAVTSAYRLV